MKRFLLFYDKAEDYQARQEPHAQAHRAYIKGFVEEGCLLLGGNLDGPHALLVFDRPDVAERFACGDPYVREGVVVSWTVRPWDVVVGTGVLD